MMRKRAGVTEDEESSTPLKADNDRGNDPEAPAITKAAVSTKEPSAMRLLCEGFLVAIAVFILATVSQEWIKTNYPSLLGNSTQAAVVGSTNTAIRSSSLASAADAISFVTAPKCTSEELAAIRKQINPASLDCVESVYQQRCPVTGATKAFDPTWLTNYYSKAETTADPFLAITVGCQDGIEAVNILRLGTMDPAIDVTAWKTAVGGGGRNQVSIPSGTAPRRTGKMYCVEEQADKVEAISKAIGSTSYASKGMNVLKYEFSSADNLENFVQKNGATDGRINYLQMETDKAYDIMFGEKALLNRTEYLIYLMDWKGAWSNYGRNTKAVTTLLDKMGFTCYWAGEGKLWRITSCLFREYGEAYKYWSHVACANRNLAPTLVDEMENVFKVTISKP